MAVRLEFLTQDSEEVELARRYWAMDEEGAYIEKVSDLVPFRKLTQSSFVSSYVRQSCLAYDENQRCCVCDGPVLVTKRHEPRKAFQLSDLPCVVCAEAVKQEELRARQAQEDELQLLLDKRSHEMASKTVSYDALPDDICVLLLALDALIGPGLATGTFRKNECDGLAPYGSGHFFMRLCEEGLISDSPLKASPGTYVVADGELRMRSNQGEFYLVADEKDGRVEEVTGRLAGREFTNTKALFELWLEYAESDVMRYLLDLCETYRLILGPDELDEIRDALRQGLHIYSVAQLWFVMWIVVKAASSYASHRHSNRTKASATIPKKIRSQIEKAIQGDGIGRSWNRPDGHPAGSLGDVFLNIFKINEQTDGRQVFRKFVLLNRSNVEGKDDLEVLAALFMRRALESQNAGAALVSLAEAVRAGSNATEALELVMEIDSTS